MNINHLKYFYDSARERNLQKAAKLNSISPGAISQAIYKLESDLNVNLLNHSKNGFQLTEQGKLLLLLCPKIFSSINEVKAKLEDSSNPFHGPIYFGTQQSLAATILPEILSKFKSTYPMVDVSFTIGHSTHMKQLLDQRKIDFAISMDNLDYGGHSKIPVFTGNFVFISSSNSIKAVDRGFLLTGDTTETKQLQALYEFEFASSLPVNMRIDSWGVIKKMAMEGHGIGFIPDYLLTKEERGLIYRKLKLPQIQYTVCCAFPESSFLNEKSIKFLEVIKRYF